MIKEPKWPNNNNEKQRLSIYHGKRPTTLEPIIIHKECFLSARLWISLSRARVHNKSLWSYWIRFIEWWFCNLHNFIDAKCGRAKWVIWQRESFIRWHTHTHTQQTTRYYVNKCRTKNVKSRMHLIKYAELSICIADERTNRNINGNWRCQKAKGKNGNSSCFEKNHTHTTPYHSTSYETYTQ